MKATQKFNRLRELKSALLILIVLSSIVTIVVNSQSAKAASLSAIPIININSINKIPTAQWSKTYGNGNGLTTGQQTSDGGYILIGEPFTKTDSLGNVQWTKDFGNLLSGQQTKDGGYILGDQGGSGTVIKTDAKGNVQWSKTYGVNGFDNSVYSVQQTSDNGYVIGIKTLDGVPMGNVNYTTIKTDINGNIIWTQVSIHDYKTPIYSLSQISDGGFILVGSDYFHESWTIKYDKDGKLLWGNTIYDKPILYNNANARISARYGQGINGGGFVVTGSGMYTPCNPCIDSFSWIGNIDNNGNELWTQLLENGPERTTYVSPTSDGGYIIGGSKNINPGVPNGNVGLIIKTDKNGNKLWSITTDIQNSYINSIQQTSDGGYIAIGEMNSKMWLEKLKISTPIVVPPVIPPVPFPTSPKPILKQ
jgi:hypothetical protein